MGVIAEENKIPKTLHTINRDKGRKRDMIERKKENERTREREQETDRPTPDSD